MHQEPIRHSRQEQLDAWQLWKQICSINGCAPSYTQPQDRETDPQRRAILHQYLVKQFCHSFNKLYFKIMSEKLPPAELVNFLDGRIVEFTTKKMEHDVRHSKCFKDYVWLNAQGKDDPLRYIAGTFIGPCSYMHNFVRDYLETHTSGYFDEKKIYTKYIPLNKTDENGNSRIDNLPDPDEFVSPDQNLPDEERTLLKKLTSELSIREKVAVLATSANIPLYAPEVTAAAGIGRDGCYLASQKATQKIREILKEVNQLQFALKELILMISDSLKSEKSLKSFLLKVSDNNSNQGDLS